MAFEVEILGRLPRREEQEEPFEVEELEPLGPGPSFTPLPPSQTSPISPEPPAGSRLREVVADDPQEKIDLPSLAGRAFVRGGTESAATTLKPFAELRRRRVAREALPQEQGPPTVEEQESRRRQAQIDNLARSLFGSSPNPIEDAVKFLETKAASIPIPKEQEGLFTEVAAAAGSTTIFVGARAVPGGQLLLPVVAGAMGSGEALERAVQDGATDEQRAEAGLLGIAPGLTDLVPIERLFRPFSRVAGFKGAIFAIARRAVEQGVIEGTQEAVQEFMQNAIEKFTRNGEQGLLEGIGRSGLVGFLVGTLFGGAAGVGARKRPPEPPPPTRPDLEETLADPRPLAEIQEEQRQQQAQAQEAERQETVARGAEEAERLRVANQTAAADRESLRTSLGLPNFGSDVTATFGDGDTVTGRLLDVFETEISTETGEVKISGVRVLQEGGEAVEVFLPDATITEGIAPAPVEVEIEEELTDVTLPDAPVEPAAEIAPALVPGERPTLSSEELAGGPPAAEPPQEPTQEEEAGPVEVEIEEAVAEPAEAPAAEAEQDLRPEILKIQATDAADFRARLEETGQVSFKGTVYRIEETSDRRTWVVKVASRPGSTVTLGPGGPAVWSRDTAIQRALRDANLDEVSAPAAPGLRGEAVEPTVAEPPAVSVPAAEQPGAPRPQEQLFTTASDQLDAALEDERRQPLLVWRRVLDDVLRQDAAREEGQADIFPRQAERAGKKSRDQFIRLTKRLIDGRVKIEPERIFNSSFENDRQLAFDLLVPLRAWEQNLEDSATALPLGATRGELFDMGEAVGDAAQALENSFENRHQDVLETDLKDDVEEEMQRRGVDKPGNIFARLLDSVLREPVTEEVTTPAEEPILEGEEVSDAGTEPVRPDRPRLPGGTRPPGVSAPQAPGPTQRPPSPDGR